MTPESAEMLAIRALQYLAGDSEQLARFLALTGIALEDLRDAADSHSFLSGVLDYLMGEEATLLSFATSAQCDPADIAVARDILSRNDGD